MALTETRPETEVTATGASAPARTLEATLATGDHKVIGRLWIGAGALFLLVGLAVSAVASFENADVSSFDIVSDGGQLVQVWSLGRDLLLFGGVLPLLVGLGTYIVPLQVGSGASAFPRGAAAAFWSWLISTILMVVAYIDNGGPAGGRLDAVVLWTVALGAVIFFLAWAMVCIASTVLGARAAGMTMDRVPVSTWGFTVFSTVGIFVLPVVIGQLILGFLDAKYGYLPTEADRFTLIAVGNTINFAPALYLVAVPALAMAVEFISVHTGRPARFQRPVMASLAALGIFAVATQFVAFSGRGHQFAGDNAVLVVILLASILPALAIFAMAGDSLRGGKPNITVPFVAAIVSMILIIAGVIVGALAAINPVIGFIAEITGENINQPTALDLNGTVFHEGLRGLILGSAIVAIIGGVYHWGVKIWGRNLSDGAGTGLVGLAALGTVLWGVGGVVAGFMEAPLLMIDSSVGVRDGVEILNIVAAVGVALLALAALGLLAGVLGAFAGRGSSSLQWSGLTLEWATDNPPITGNFATPPVVHSATPLADADPSAEESN